MIAQHSYEYIKIGLAVRLLRALDPNVDTADFTVGVLQELEALLQAAGFNVTLVATQSSSYLDMVRLVEELPKHAPVGAVAATVREESSRIENVLFAEAVTKRIYTLPERRFNTEALLKDPSRLLKGGAYEKLSEIGRNDFSSACRCILFGEATAAAFHILRATESVLKSYYFHHRRQNRLAKPMWGSMTEQLRAKTRNKPPETLLTSLDLVRTAYRNPTNHPEAIYQIDSAQDLFGVCIDVIGKMTDEL